MEIGQNLLEFFQSVLQPLYLVGIGAGALYFLFRREVSQLLGFMLVSVLVGTFIFAPRVWADLAEFFGSLLTAGA